jgi:hypothetical protein
MIARKSKPGELSNARRAARLGSSLENLLSAYASAAVAAGVSLLAVTKAAEAKIIYTSAHTNIPSSSEPVLLDLNHDGIADFSFWHWQLYSSKLDVGCAAGFVASRHSSTCVSPQNEVWGKGTSSGRYASALRAGLRVGPSKSYFQQGGQKGASSYPPRGPAAVMGKVRVFRYGSGNLTYGQFMYTRSRYLGLQFVVDGQVHYGWARVAVAVTGSGQRAIQATLTGYAYETIPGKPIIAGKTKGPDVVTWEPATLGRLAQGASGITAWREKK